MTINKGYNLNLTIDWRIRAAKQGYFIGQWGIFYTFLADFLRQTGDTNFTYQSQSQNPYHPQKNPKNTPKPLTPQIKSQPPTQKITHFPIQFQSTFQPQFQPQPILT